MLRLLESNPRATKNTKYKLDYIFAIGDNTYFVGEQYREWAVTQRSSYGISNTYWNYEYMDVIVAKLNKAGEFEWVSNTPLRNAITLSNVPHVFKQYIAVATESSIYIIPDSALGIFAL